MESKCWCIWGNCLFTPDYYRGRMRQSHHFAFSRFLFSLCKLQIEKSGNREGEIEKLRNREIRKSRKKTRNRESKKTKTRKLEIGKSISFPVLSGSPSRFRDFAFLISLYLIFQISGLVFSISISRFPDFSILRESWRRMRNSSFLYCTVIPLSQVRGRVGIPPTCLTPPHYLCMCLSQVRSM